jgi:subtilase family serine protease
VRSLCRTLVVLAVLSLSLAATASAGAATVRVGTAPQLPDGASAEGGLAPGHPLDLVVALEPRDPTALAAYAEAVSTPGSPLYGRYLSVGEFAARFAPTPAQVATVRSALAARGLEVGAPSANGLSLPVDATASEAGSAFGTAISRVELADGEASYANLVAPAIPAAAAPYVQGVIGLDDLDHPHRSASPTGDPLATAPLAPAPTASDGPLTGGPLPCADANAARVEGEYNGYTGDQLAAAYGLTGFYAAGNFGAGQTVALYEEEPFLPSDIETFQACYGTHVPVEAVDIGKGPGSYKGEDGEAAMDIEQIVQLAPGARIRVYQGPNVNPTGIEILTRWVSDNDAKVMSSSWGSCEHETADAEAKATDTLLQEAAVQGQSFFVAAGDFGSTDCEDEETKNSLLNVDYPGSDPFATDVGGTRMENPTSPSPTDLLWNEAPHWGAGGGGISEKFAMPDYQANAAPSLGVLSTLSSGKDCAAAAGYCRQVPDVSADASQETGYVIYTEGHWNINGGTSAAAPLWAALATLTNASAGCEGRTIGFANPALYAVAGADYDGNFRDVVEAKPGGKPTTSRYDDSDPFPAGPGYDMASGIGTPIGSSLAASLCALGTPPAPTPPAPAADAAKAAPPTPPPSPAHASRTRLAGIGKGRPRLSFGLEARAGASLEAVSIALPAGLLPAAKAKDLAAGLIVREAGGKRLKASARATGRTIRVRLASPRPALNLTLRAPALTVTPKLTARAQHGSHKATVVVTTTETGGTTARFPLSLPLA